MTQLMYDSINAGTIPRNAKAVAAYVDGWWPSFGAVAARFHGKAHCLSITVHGARAACCDCESGDLSPVQAERWVGQMLALGVWRPVVYADQSTWDSGLYAALRHYGTRIRRWTASYPGIGARVPAGYDAHQFTDHGPHGENYDISVIRDDFFPGVPKAKPVVKRPVHPKVAAAAIAGAITTGIEALLHAKGIAGWKPTPAEVSAITTAAAAIAGYLKSSGTTG